MSHFRLKDCDFNWECLMGTRSSEKRSHLLLTYDRWFVERSDVPVGEYPQSILEEMHRELSYIMETRLEVLNDVLEGEDFQRRCEIELEEVRREKPTRGGDWNRPPAFDAKQVNCLKLTLNHYLLKDPVMVEIRIGSENFPVKENHSGQYVTDETFTGATLALAFDTAYRRVRDTLAKERQVLVHAFEKKGN